MIIKYDVPKLKKIIDDLSVVTGITLGIKDKDFNFLFDPPLENDPFCNALQCHPCGVEKCTCSDLEMLEKTNSSKAPFSHVCHAGIIDTLVPIVRQNTVLGYVIIGRIRSDRDFSEIKNRVSWMGEEALTELENHYKCLRYITKTQLESLIRLVSSLIFEDAIEITYDSRLAQITGYIDSNPEKDLSVTELCRRFFISKNYLYKSFRQQLDTTVGEYVSRSRLGRAAELLKNTDGSAAEIAERCGFGNYTYFTKLFKRIYGRSPTLYRRL